MHFIDEVEIRVVSGKGGDGCMSFLRERNRALGGPNGGDGGHGGCVWLEAIEALNTLVDYIHCQTFSAGNGEQGRGKLQSGAKGEDLVLPVPVGTLVYNSETGELIADLVEEGARCLVAQGGGCGMGNARYKSSTNRSPRHFTHGGTGESRELQLQLKLLADVGLLGMPNAGKSTLIRKLSSARPKVADYPFTTTTPHLGTVRAGDRGGFVIADIPGLIEGAAQGKGLGHKFLRHLERTRLMLHVVEIHPDGVDHILDQVRLIEEELRSYSNSLFECERWLLINKIDLVPAGSMQDEIAALLEALQWKDRRCYTVSGISGAGLEVLVRDLAHHLNSDSDEEVWA